MRIAVRGIGHFMTTANFETHGRIKCATITTPLFVRSLNDYRRVLGYESVEDGIISEDLADSWVSPDSAGKRYAILQPKSGAASFIRLIEASATPRYEPLRSFGWASLALSVSDIASLHEDIEADGAFTIIALPQLDEQNHMKSMLICGQAGEIVSLNQVTRLTDDLHFPAAVSSVDQIFKASLAVPNRQTVLDHYVQAYGFEAGMTGERQNVAINQAYGLQNGTTLSTSMIKVGHLPIVEIEQYPHGTDVRPMSGNELPPGIAMMSIAIDNLDTIEDDFVTEPSPRSGLLYAGRRVATVMGPTEELIELIEIGID
jgi:hypothetical protein